ncbi:MAG: hypothetical protein NTZ46_00215 [Verrucomicrobia bacterium]|nr:hypothetical protein [Verrucomicrobiota bacterium]
MKKPSGAFTFVEILAALIFLAILIPAILEGLTLSSRAAVTAERSALAAELAQNKLGELMLNDEWASGENKGEFGEALPGMRWEVTQSSWDMDSMTLLKLEVFFQVQGQEKSVSLSTLVDPNAAGATTSTSSSASSGQSSIY